MEITFYDILEVGSPLLGFAGCTARIHRSGVDKLNIIIFFSLPVLSYLHGYAVFLQSNGRNNISVYTLVHALMLCTFCSITYLLINKKLIIFFCSVAAGFISLLFFEAKNFDAYHSLNGPLSAWFAYTLIICGLIIITYLAKGYHYIRNGYQYFSIWFAVALVLYFTSIFLIYIGFDYIMYVDAMLNDTLWKVSTLGLSFFFLLIGIGFIKRENFVR